jgi:hypothetical protein
MSLLKISISSQLQINNKLLPDVGLEIEASKDFDLQSESNKQ